MQRSVRGASNDIDREGQAVGNRFSQGVADGVRNSERDLHRDVDRSMARFSAGSDGTIHDRGAVLGDHFTRGIGNGIRRNESGLHREIQASMARFVVGGDGVVEDHGSELADRFTSKFSNRLRTRLTGMRNDIRDGFTRISDVGDDMRTNIENRLNRLRTVGDRVGRDIGRRLGLSTREGLAEATPNLGAEGERMGAAVRNGIDRDVRRNRRGLGSAFSGLGGDLMKSFNLGIGAARMGPAIISLLATAGPSVLAGAAALGTALAAELVTAMAAIGPGLAGAFGVGLAAVATLGLNLGLLKLAFSGTGTQAKAFKAEFADFRTVLTDAFAPGVLSGFSDLIGKLRSDLLPAVNSLLKDTGIAMGNVARGFADTVTSGANLGRIQGILSTNRAFLDNFGVGLNGLTTSFLILFNASKPFVDFLGESVKRFGEWASASLGVSEANGNLASWMNGMLASFKDLWAILQNIGGGIANVFQAAAPAGETLLGSLRGIAERFHAWTSDSGNMARMTAFFDKAHTLASKVFDVLGSIFTAGGNAFSAMDLGPIMHVLDTLQNVIAPAIARFFNQIQAGASSNLVAAFDNIGTALTKIADSGNFERVANLISTIILKLSEFAASDFGSTILSFVLPFVVMGGILTSLLGPLLAVGKGIFSLASVATAGEGALAGLGVGALGLTAIIAAVAGAFVLIAANSESFRNSLVNLASVVGGAFSAAWDQIAPKLQEVWDKVQQLAAAIGDRLAPVIQFLTPIIADAINFIGEIFSNILDAIGGFIDIITGILTGNWTLIWQGVVEVLGAAWDQIKTIFALGLAIISAVWDTITAVIYAAGQVIYGVINTAMTGIWGVITTVWNAVFGFIEGILTAILDNIRAFGNWIHGIWMGIYNQIIEVVTNLASGLGNIWNNIMATGRAIWDAILNVAKAIWQTIVDAVTGKVEALPGDLLAIWNSITSGIKTAWDGLVSIVLGIWNSISSSITGPIESAYNTVSEWIGRIAGIVKGILSTVGSAFTTVTSQVATMTQKIADTKAQQASLGAVTADPLAAAGGILGPGGISRILASIPALALGGVINPTPGGTLFIGGEAGRRERVEPLDSQGLSARDRALIKLLAGEFAGARGGGAVNVYLSGQKIAQFVEQVVDNRESSLARRVRTMRPA